MKHAFSTFLFGKNAQAGTSLVELLITVAIVSISMAMMSSFTIGSSSSAREVDTQVEANQGLRAMAEILSLELRQTGACLPPGGEFISLDGADIGDFDSLTVRVGHSDPNTMACVMSGSISQSPGGSSTIEVPAGEADNFHIGNRLYIRPANGANGAFHELQAKSGGATGIELHVSPSLNGVHEAGSGVYPVDQRDYAIDTIGGVQAMTMSIDQGPPNPMIDQVNKFNVKYHLEPCIEGICDEVKNLPQDDAEWSRVRMVTIEVEVQSANPDQHGNPVIEQETITVKPRNFV